MAEEEIPTYDELMHPDDIRAIDYGLDPESPTNQELKDIEWAKRVLYYSNIQTFCKPSGNFIEHNDFVNMVAPLLPICPQPEIIAEDYIEKYGIDPEVTCFDCSDTGEGGQNENNKLGELCDPCNKCINFEYDKDCKKLRRWYLVFDKKAVRYWTHPSTKVSLWDCEVEAIRAWESDTPPASKGKQQLSFHDPRKRKGKVCPHKSYPPDTPDSEKVKVKNDFKWCTPTWNDQCRFVVIEFYDRMDGSFTIGTDWKVMKKCNQEECDLAEDDGLNRLGRHAKLCKDRCYDLSYPSEDPWEGNLVNYTHNYW